MDVNYSKQTLDAVLPCLSGCVSEGWHVRTVRYDDLHLGTTGGREDRVIFNRTAEQKINYTLIRPEGNGDILGQRNKNCNNYKWLYHNTIASTSTDTFLFVAAEFCHSILYSTVCWIYICCMLFILTLQYIFHMICKHRLSVSRYILWEPIKLFSLNFQEKIQRKITMGQMRWMGQVTVNKGGKLSDCWKFIIVLLRRRKKKNNPEKNTFCWKETFVGKNHSFVDSATSLINGFFQKQKLHRKCWG